MKSRKVEFEMDQTWTTVANNVTFVASGGAVHLRFVQLLISFHIGCLIIDVDYYHRFHTFHHIFHQLKST